MIRGTFGPGTIVLGGGALLLIGVLALGFFLPTDWEANAEARIEANPGELMPFLDSPEGWRTWTAWPDSGLVRSGPERGVGAAMSWDDRELGSGSFTIAEVAPSGVHYVVEVAGAANTVMTTEGWISLEQNDGGTLVLWKESGDLGRNPLMGYWALSMEKAQTAEMGKSLDRLEEVVHEAPADTVPTGAP